ncbi:MAG: YeeE/YedE family protein, partial [Rhodospirillales bacterium]|nr:YeeE/YedE family protein [Rhodospirillales bacterium]
MENFTPGSALVGGAVIGLSAVLLMALLGRIAGISGIVGGLIRPAAGEAGWRAAFLIGLVAGPVLWGAVGGRVPPVEITAELPVLIAGGLLV